MIRTVKSSKEWQLEVPKEFKLVILDPDGWDRKNYEFSFNQKKITKEEFKLRLSKSTVSCDVKLFSIQW